MSTLHLRMGLLNSSMEVGSRILPFGEETLKGHLDVLTGIFKYVTRAIGIANLESICVAFRTKMYGGRCGYYYFPRRILYCLSFFTSVRPGLNRLPGARWVFDDGRAAKLWTASSIPTASQLVDMRSKFVHHAVPMHSGCCDCCTFRV